MYGINNTHLIMNIDVDIFSSVKKLFQKGETYFFNLTIQK